ncbi:MAG: protein phosphatase 2C domain-containing protein, partial [Kofleriaceae bacterium]
DPDRGIFVVCDGMGGHAAGEVASRIAVETVRKIWCGPQVEDLSKAWIATGTARARRALLAAVRAGANAAHDAIVKEAEADRSKHGMGTTLVGVLIVGSDAVVTHAGDSRAYLVRGRIPMQLTEDHTLVARLQASGVDMEMTPDIARFRSMLTNALGIGDEGKAQTFMAPLIDGDRLLLCSDGISEYVDEEEVGQVLTQQPSPTRAAQRLVELALERGGHDNATAVVLRVLEAGVSPRAQEDIDHEREVALRCPLFKRLTPQRLLRALHITLGRDLASGELLPSVALGSRVAWIIIDGEVEWQGQVRGPGGLIYAESLIPDRAPIERERFWQARTEVHALLVRGDDFTELCNDDAEVAEILYSSLADALTAGLG